MRQEGLCLLRLPPPLQLQTANDNILRGMDPPTKEDPEKRKQHEKLGSGEAGRGTRSRGEAEMVLSVSECLCGCLRCCSINTAGP